MMSASREMCKFDACVNIAAGELVGTTFLRLQIREIFDRKKNSLQYFHTENKFISII
jgi:hypothetical protein